MPEVSIPPDISVSVLSESDSLDGSNGIEDGGSLLVGSSLQNWDGGTILPSQTRMESFRDEIDNRDSLIFSTLKRHITPRSGQMGLEWRDIIRRGELILESVPHKKN
ncbi:hypothetical protein HAX54_024214 [Datura stramonium]|uniref:Uncharacterized protein n=1 Tax=Datura stramonium TaxID=4076 RepID=A0ABS8S5K0_DATST|nr:hypothetical protein [Datura stramonium]